MSTKGFLRKQVNKSQAEGRTQPVLRGLVFNAVELALHKHYGENYSNRCIQSASAVVRLLGRCGIDSLLIRGEACFGHVNGSRLEWSSFGGTPERFHCWTMTLFAELIDLTVRQQHLAPGVEPGGFPSPAVWWNDAVHMPAALRYLPGPREGRIAVSLADPEEDAIFKHFMKSANLAFDALLKDGLYALQFPVVSSVDDLNRMSQSGDPWAGTAWRFDDLPLPAWAQRRMHELAEPEKTAQIRNPRPREE